MSDEETKNAELRKKWEEDTRKVLDDELVARYQHFKALAFRMLVGEPKVGEFFTYDEAELRHLAEMLLLLDIARGSPPGRYAGNY